MIIVSTDTVLARALEVMLGEAGITNCRIAKALPQLYDFAVVDLDSAECDLMKKNVLTISADRKKGAGILRPFSESAFLAAVKDLIGGGLAASPEAASHSLILTENGFSYKGREVLLTPREMLVFSLLYRNAGGCVSSEQIAAALGRESTEGSEVTVYISFLRKKLDIAFGERIICNERGKGYTLRLPDADRGKQYRKETDS